MIAEATRPFHVLLVEDDPADVMLIEEALGDSDAIADLAQAGDGVEALEHLRDADRPRPDLIVLDLNMPRMSGAELLSVLKSDDDLRSIPVVVLTTSGAPEHIEAAYRDHASAYVIKPLSLDEFTEAVRDINDFFRHTAARPPRP
jgi:CheY-like chemotaxis protein